MDKIERQPTETRIVESAQIDRQVYRDVQTDIIRVAPGLDDEQNLRFQCVSLACGVVEKPIFGGNDESPKVEEAVLRIADSFVAYITDGSIS